MDRIGVGILGCGAIGLEVATALLGREIPNLELRAAAYRQLSVESEATFVAAGVQAVTDPKDWPVGRLGVVLEAAGAQALALHGPALLRGGVDVMVMSAAALLDDRFLHELQEAAESGGSRILVPGGAITGLDAVRAAAVAGSLLWARLKSYKAPAGWSGNPYLEARGIRPELAVEPLCIFRGPAREAARHFPKNVNIAAALALAGLGPDHTEVELWADPGAAATRHFVSVEARYFQLEVEIRTQPSPVSPRTSMLAVEQALGALAAQASILRVG